MIMREKRLGGYSADVDDDTFTAEDYDDASASIASITTSHFYSNIKPKRRRKTSRATTRDINLNLVSLVSSEKFENQCAGKSDSTVVANPSSTFSSGYGSSSSSGSASELTSGQQTVSSAIIKKKCMKRKEYDSRPIAAIDFGSIDLDMSSSLLDSIYKVGGTDVRNSCVCQGVGEMRSDLTFGGEQLSTQVMVRERAGAISNSKPQVKDASRSSGIAVAPYMMKNDAHTSNNQTSTEVHQQKEEAVRYVRITPTTLEEAISFSPYAR